MKKKLGLLYGGKSAEHEVSLQTALAVIKAINFEAYDVYPIFINKKGAWLEGKLLRGPVSSVEELIVSDTANNALLTLVNGETSFDVIFPLLHGPNGEDGTVQGLLEVINLPYVGNGVLASSAGMDKIVMKNIFDQAKLPQVDYLASLRHEWEQDQGATLKLVEERLAYPVYVKPANLGSSVGISKCDNREELAEAFVEAFKYDRRVIVEQGILAREIEVAILGNEDAKCSVAGEIVPKTDFYDYDAKYKDGTTELVIPANISEAEFVKIKTAALKAYRALDCAGLVRADFFLTNQGEAYINEVNTMPGFTPFSMFPLLWDATGITYPELIERLIDLALQRHSEKQAILHSY